MHHVFKELIIRSVLNKSKSGLPAVEQYSSYRISKGYIAFKTLVLRLLKDIILIGMGITSAAIGLESFLLPSNFIDGGATGMALLTAEVFNIPLPLLLVVINIPFVFLGYKIIGKEFAIKAAIAITGLALCLTIFHFPIITEDKLLVAVFGGFCLGAGIGLSVRGGAVLDGTEVLAIFLSRKIGTTIGDVIIMINIVIFGFAAYLLSIETALYSLITYLAAAKTMDFIIEGIEEYIGVTIISLKHNEIKQMIIDTLGRGITVYPGAHGYGKGGVVKKSDVLYTVITRLELSKLNSEIARIDKEAFVVVSSIKDTKGGMIKKRPLQH